MEEFLVIFDTYDGYHGLERYFDAIDSNEAIRKCIEQYPESLNHSAIPFQKVVTQSRRSVQ